MSDDRKRARIVAVSGPLGVPGVYHVDVELPNGEMLYLSVVADAPEDAEPPAEHRGEAHP